jgi:hypothetical protein
MHFMRGDTEIDAIARKYNTIVWGLDPNDYISDEQAVWRLVCCFAPFRLYGTLQHDEMARA